MAGCENYRWNCAKGEYVRVPNPRKKAKRARRRAARARSPRAPVYLKATPKKGNGPVLTYMGGIKFSATGRGVPFHTKAQARTVANELKRHFPVLKHFNVKPV